LPTGVVTVGPLTPAPANQQQGLLLPFLAALSKSVQNVIPSQPAAAPPDSSFTPITNTPVDPSLTAVDSSGTTFYQTPTAATTFNPGTTDQVEGDVTSVNLLDNSPSGLDNSED
jgi:hypothetical protein